MIKQVKLDLNPQNPPEQEAARWFRLACDCRALIHHSRHLKTNTNEWMWEVHAYAQYGPLRDPSKEQWSAEPDHRNTTVGHNWQIVDARTYSESKKKWFWERTRRRWNEWLTEWEIQTETLFNRHVWTVQVSPSDTGNVLTLTTVYSVNHTVALWDMPAGQRLFTYTKNTRAHTLPNFSYIYYRQFLFI